MQSSGRVGTARAKSPKGGWGGARTPRRVRAGAGTPAPLPTNRAQPDLSVTLDEIARREEARSRLIPFCEYMWHGFERRPYRELIAASLEMLEAREITRLMIFAPSQFGKSELVSRNYPAWYLGRNPDDAQIMCSYAGELAFALSFDARNRVMDPSFRALFGDLSLYDVPVEISSERAATKEWRLQYHRGRVKAAGVGAGVSGFPADQILIDDALKDDSDAGSAGMQEKLMRWYTGQIYGRLSPKGVICICNTRWHEQDLSGQLLKAQADGGELWHVLRLTAVAEPPHRIRDWADRSNITVDRLITADHVLKTGRGYT